MSNPTRTPEQTPPSLADFWLSTLTARLSLLPLSTLTAEHDAICARFDEAMTDGFPLPASAWRHLGALQAERGRRADLPAGRPALTGPFLAHYETSVGDAPGALPIRLSGAVLVF